MGKERIITIMVAIDVIGALASDTLEGNIYLFDNNRSHGSVGHGTGKLMTKLRMKDDVTLLWNIMPIEPESFADISDISTDGRYLTVERGCYEGSDVMYWKGNLTGQPFHQTSYRLSIKVGNRDMAFVYDLELIGHLTH